MRGGHATGAAHEPAHDQIRDQKRLQITVGARLGPGAHDLGADQLFNSEGGGHARAVRSGMKARAGDHHGGGVVVEADLNEGVIGRLGQHQAIDAGFGPRKDGAEEEDNPDLHPAWHSGQIGGTGAHGGWYTTNHKPPPGYG